MYIKIMNPLLMEIYQIKNLEDIKIYDLVPASLRNNDIVIIPALYIRYDSGKTLNLCSKDKYFDVYVRKVYEVYTEEKNRTLVDKEYDPFGFHTHISIDEKTKNILETGNGNISSLIKVLSINENDYDESFVFQKDELLNIWQMIKYHLTDFLKLMGKTLTFPYENIDGYRNNYSIECQINGLYATLCMHYQKKDINNYELLIKIVGCDIEPLKLNICFTNNSINVVMHLASDELTKSSTYAINDNGLKITDYLSKKDETISYKEYNADSAVNSYPNLIGIDDLDTYTWYALPWQAYYGTNNSISELSEIEFINEVHNKYLDVSNNKFLIKEYYSKTYNRRQTMVAKPYYVVLEEIKKDICGIDIDTDIYLITISYQDSINLDNKYSYYLVKGSINDITKDNLISISKYDNVFTAADILNKAHIRALTNRRV